jgi:lysophospholipase L1-like esterase
MKEKEKILFLGIIIIIIIFIFSIYIIKVQMKEKEKILFLGSSIIDEWDTSSFFPNSINLGIIGFTTNDLIEYYPIIKKIKNITTIILYIGSNDVVKNNQETQIINNIIQFLLLLKKTLPHVKIIYISIIKSPKKSTDQKIKIDYINKQIYNFTKIHSNWLIFCNVNKELQSINNYQYDKNHLSEEGYKILSKNIKQLIN